MMKRVKIFCCLLLPLFLFGQSPTFEWAIHQGGSFVDRSFAIATDTAGNVYTTGCFLNNQVLSDTADFDPGINFYGLVSNGDADIFVSKLNTEGDLLWAVSFGSSGRDAGYGITVDADGSVYITGTFRGWVDFDPSSGVFPLSTSLNYSDIFVLKLDTNGNLIWARQMGGATHDFGESIVVDNNGNVYTIGNFTSTADFDPSPDVFNITYNSDAEYKSDVFISKLDNDGNFVWAKAIGGEGGELGKSIELDSFNNIYSVGNFSETVDFDPGTAEYNISTSGNSDMFILKLSTNGEFIWAKNIGGTSSVTSVTSISIDAHGNTYTTGSFDGYVDFDPEIGESNLLSSARDIFILKLNKDGGLVWVKSLGGESSDGGNSIKVDEYNNVYSIGLFRDSVDFNPGLDSFYLSATYGDIYVLKLDSNGSFNWVVSFSSDDDVNGDSNIGRSIDLDKQNNIYTTGYFVDTTDFAPDTMNHDLVTYGSSDIFIQKMSQPCNANLSIKSNNNDFATCSQEPIMLNAVLLSSFEDVFYTWNTGETSDSIVVTPDSTSTYVVTANYMNNNEVCVFLDSVEVIVLEIPDTTYLDFMTCDSLSVGMIEFVYPSQNECDSIVIEINSLMPIPNIPVAPADIMIDENEPSFQIGIIEVPGASSYFWEVPSGVSVISGQGTNSLTLDWNGLITNGSVCVSAINECGSSLPDCMEVTVEFTDGVEDIKDTNYSIFPNPVSDFLNVVFEGQSLFEVTLLDVSGRAISRIEEIRSQIILSTQKLPSGTYWLKIVSENEVFWEQIEITK